MALFYLNKNYEPVGDLRGIPINIIALMLQEQYLQNNPISLQPFEKVRSASTSVGGFDWNVSRQGVEFWRNILSRRMYDMVHNFKINPEIIEIVDDNESVTETTSISQDATDKFILKKEHLIGALMGFPIEFVALMLTRQNEVNDIDISVFQNSINADKDHGGFNWFDTEEGYSFWYDRIKNHGEDYPFDDKTKYDYDKNIIEIIDEEIKDMTTINKFILKREHLSGALNDTFPLQFVALMLTRQYEAVKKIDITVFQKDITAGQSTGGFNWSSSDEGFDYWNDRINNHRFIPNETFDYDKDLIKIEGIDDNNDFIEIEGIDNVETNDSELSVTTHDITIIDEFCKTLSDSGLTDEQVETIRKILLQNEELKSAINEIKSEAVDICNIAAISTEEDNLDVRIELGNAHKVAKCISKDLKQELELGDEVVIAGNTIIYKLPSDLTTKKEATEFEKISWDAIGGMSSQIEIIRNAVENPLIHEELYKLYNLKPYKGILLYGPPGCGKTLIAKAIASALIDDIDNDSFIYIKGAELLNPYVGVTEQKIKGIFKQARDYTKNTGKRCVIFIDEAEAILNKRGSRRSSDVDTTIVPTFLSEMDGFESNDSLVILATNYKNNLDDAIIRPGRVDLHIEISNPTKSDAEEIFQKHLEKTLIAEDITTLSQTCAQLLYQILPQTQVTGALIAKLVQDGINLAIKDSIANHDDKDYTHGLNKKHMEIAIQAVIPEAEVVSQTQMFMEHN